MYSIRFLFVNHTIDLGNKAGWVIRPGYPEEIPLTYLDLLFDRSAGGEQVVNKSSGRRLAGISRGATLILAGRDPLINPSPGKSFIENIKYVEADGNTLFNLAGNGEKYNLIVVDQFMSLSDGLDLSAKLRQFETTVSPGNHIRIFALAPTVSEEEILRMWDEGISFQACHTHRTANTIEVLRELQIFENHMKF